MNNKIIAVDFDGCLVTDRYPEIGEPITQTIDALKCEIENGARVILWTCRCGEYLKAAEDWCKEQGIKIHAVNENFLDVIDKYGSDSRKLSATEFWDDRAVVMPNINNPKLPETEYSEKFDTLRKNRVAVSFHKYGTAKINFGDKIVEALPTTESCIEKYVKSKNTEYLVDAANYLMFEYMYPSIDGAYFQATSDKESAGIVGVSIKEMENMKNEDY